MDFQATPCWGNVNSSGRAASWAWAHLSAASIDQLGTTTLPQFKLIFSCTPWYSHSSCYGWCTSGCSVSLLTGHRGHSGWSSCPFWLVMVSILIGHGIYSNWSQQYFSLVTMSILIGHSIHLDWSQCPFWFIRTSFYLVSAHAVAVAKYFAYHPFCP